MATSFKGEEVDVVIVGSGAGGAPLALELAKAGAKVVVLEKGPWYQRDQFQMHDEIATCRRDFFTPLVKDEPHVVQRASGPPQKTADGWISQCVGGGTVHMSGFVFRLHPDDFKMKTLYGGLEGADLADWPIGYEDLAPYYDKVEKVVGVSGKVGGNPYEPPRTGDYPYPPLATHPMRKLVDQGAAKMGLHPFETPRAIISRGEDGRGPCVYHPVCGSYGCETGAKSSTLSAVIPKALATGKCEVRPHSMVFEVVKDPKDTGRVTGVKYVDAQGGRHEQKARVVVVSATAIESARLLLNSGVANGSGLVGRNLMLSTLGKGWGAFERTKLPAELAEDHNIRFIHRSIQDYYRIAERKGGYDKGGTLHYLLPHVNPIHTAERLSRRGRPRLWGERLMQELHRYYHEVRELEFEVFGEWLPTPGTRVTVSSDVKDRWGIPSAHIHLAPHPEDRKNSRYIAERGVDLLRAAGATRSAIDISGGVTWVLQHGTCRFGTDPDASVLNPDCRAHEVDNLYVVDGSFMPSSGGVPTTLTILANSFRVADKLVERFKRRDVK